MSRIWQEDAPVETKRRILLAAIENAEAELPALILERDRLHAITKRHARKSDAASQRVFGVTERMRDDRRELARLVAVEEPVGVAVKP